MTTVRLPTLLLTLFIVALAASSAVTQDKAGASVARDIPRVEIKLPGPAMGGQRVVIRELLPGEIPEVSTRLVSIFGPATFSIDAGPRENHVLLFLKGQATLRTRDRTIPVEGETIARMPVAWPLDIDVAASKSAHLLLIQKQLSAADLEDLKRYPDNNAGPWVKKFSECKPYGEAIKSAKTVSRTLLPENFVPRVALGTVETTGPDKVAYHTHPMLEQLFLGLQGCDATVLADGAQAPMREYDLLHIPVGSSHGAKVDEGKKLYYVWMDFFGTREGQVHLQTHKALVDTKPDG